MIHCRKVHFSSIVISVLLLLLFVDDDVITFDLLLLLLLWVWHFKNESFWVFFILHWFLPSSSSTFAIFLRLDTGGFGRTLFVCLFSSQSMHFWCCPRSLFFSRYTNQLFNLTIYKLLSVHIKCYRHCRRVQSSSFQFPSLNLCHAIVCHRINCLTINILSATITFCVDQKLFKINIKCLACVFW